MKANTHKFTPASLLIACSAVMSISAYAVPEDPGPVSPSLSAPSQIKGMASNLLNMANHGAHHVPLQMQGAGRNVWLTSDYATNNHYDSDLGLVEVGASEAYWNDQLIAGFGIGQSWFDQDLDQGGEADIDGQYLLGELSYRATGSPFIYTLTATYGDWEADIERGYTGGPSRGSTDVNAAALRLRADWLDAANYAGFSISPKVEYTYFYTKMDGYTETGGTSAATFSENSEPSHQLRYGLTASREVCDGNAMLRVRAEGVYRVDGGSSRTSGTQGLSIFNVQGPSVRQHWALVGLDFDYDLSERAVLTTGISGATDGDDPTFGATLGVRVSF